MIELTVAALIAAVLLGIFVHLALWERRENKLWREHWKAWRDLRARYGIGDKR